MMGLSCRLNGNTPQTQTLEDVAVRAQLRARAAVLRAWGPHVRRRGPTAAPQAARRPRGVLPDGARRARPFGRVGRVLVARQAPALQRRRRRRHGHAVRGAVDARAVGRVLVDRAAHARAARSVLHAQVGHQWPAIG